MNETSVYEQPLQTENKIENDDNHQISHSRIRNRYDNSISIKNQYGKDSNEDFRKNARENILDSKDISKISNLANNINYQPEKSHNQNEFPKSISPNLSRIIDPRNGNGNVNNDNNVINNQLPPQFNLTISMINREEKLYSHSDDDKFKDTSMSVILTGVDQLK